MKLSDMKHGLTFYMSDHRRNRVSCTVIEVEHNAVCVQYQDGSKQWLYQIKKILGPTVWAAVVELTEE